MDQHKPDFTTIDEYISLFPESTQKMLAELRALIKKEAPQAQEKISWRMPTFYLHGNLVHFAAFAKHIGFYPGASGVENFEPELAEYKHAKGSVQFQIGQPLPVELIKKIVRFRVAENTGKQKK